MNRYLLLALVVLTACSSSDSDGEGAVEFTTWGEDYIEEGIPAADVADGWSIAYDKFLVALSEVTVAEDGAAPVAKMVAPRVFDMHAPGEKAVAAFTGLPAKAYTHVTYALSPATEEAELGAGATEADRRTMIDGHYSVWVSATATKGQTSKRLSWGFSTSTLNERCKGPLDGKEVDGVVVTNGGTDVVQLTIHGDHLFYDDLQSPDAKLRFDSIAAADADGDGVVTLEELAAVDLASIPKERGPYGTGSASGINDLRAFVEALSRTVGHFRGEGECLARPR